MPGLPPVEVMFRASGAEDVLKAFKSIQQAAIDVARTQVVATNAAIAGAKAETEAIKGKERASKEAGKAASDAANAEKSAAKAAADELKRNLAAQKEREKAIKDQIRLEEARQRAIAAGARELESRQRASAPRAQRVEVRDLFGNVVEAQARNKGVEQMSSSKAFQAIFGQTASQLIGLYGPAGQLVGAFNLLKGAVSLAASALTGFGSFILTDIIQPQLKLGTWATQMSNRISGTASAGAIKGSVNALYATNAQAELGDVQKVFGAALDKTHNIGQAQTVADLALKANKAYGFDAGQLANFIASKRAALSGLSDNAFKNLIGNEIGAGKDVGGDFNAFLARAGDIQKISGYLNTGGRTDIKAGNDAAITALMAAGAREGRTPATIATGMTQLIKDLQLRPEVFGINRAQSNAGTAQDLIEKFIPTMLKNVGGNLKDTKYTLGLAEGVAGTRPLNQTSREFLQSLGVDKVYQSARGGDAEKAEAVRAYLKSLIGLTDATKASAGVATLEADAKKTEQDAGYQFEQALRDLKVALLPIMPIVTGQLIPAFRQATPAIVELLNTIAKELGDAGLKTALDSLVKAVATVAYGILRAYNWVASKTGGKQVDESAFEQLGKIAGFSEYANIGVTGKAAAKLAAKRDEMGSDVLLDENGNSLGGLVEAAPDRMGAGLGRTASATGLSADEKLEAAADKLAKAAQKFGESADDIALGGIKSDPARFVGLGIRSHQ